MTHNCNDNILDDYTTRRLAEYIRDNLNIANPILNTIIVNSIRNYDAFNIPIQDYPLLKVSRLRTNHRISDKVISTIAVDYLLALPDLDKLAGYVKWIDFKTNELLSFVVHELDIHVDKQSRNSDYRITLTELQPVILRVLRITFNITEGN